MELTYKVKTLSAREKLEIEERKAERILKAMNHCSECDNYFPSSKLQFAHRIPKYKSYVEKYGYEVIHHEKNTPITCPDCNIKVSLNPSSNPVEAQELVDEIMKELGCD